MEKYVENVHQKLVSDLFSVFRKYPKTAAACEKLFYHNTKICFLNTHKIFREQV